MNTKRLIPLPPTERTSIAYWGDYWGVRSPHQGRWLLWTCEFLFALFVNLPFLTWITFVSENWTLHSFVLTILIYLVILCQYRQLESKKKKTSVLLSIFLNMFQCGGTFYDGQLASGPRAHDASATQTNRLIDFLCDTIKQRHLWKLLKIVPTLWVGGCLLLPRVANCSMRKVIWYKIYFWNTEPIVSKFSVNQKPTGRKIANAAIRKMVGRIWSFSLRNFTTTATTFKLVKKAFICWIAEENLNHLVVLDLHYNFFNLNVILKRAFLFFFFFLRYLFLVENFDGIRVSLALPEGRTRYRYCAVIKKLKQRAQKPIKLFGVLHLSMTHLYVVHRTEKRKLLWFADTQRRK